jgi:hypothetical protein
MGAYATVDKKLVNDILIQGRTNTIIYPLTDSQSNEIRSLFNSIRHQEDLPTTRRICGKRVTQYSTIGYYKGDIIAFRFQKSKHPFIFFEYKNENYRSWTELIKRSYQKKKRGVYEEIFQLFIEFYTKNEDFYFVKSMNEDYSHLL